MILGWFLLAAMGATVAVGAAVAGWAGVLNAGIVWALIIALCSWK